MKVLLLGEFSGLYKNLYDGLITVGIDAKWASNGDDWKKIGGADSLVFSELGKGFSFRKAYNHLIFPLIDKRFSKYDVVQAITPMIYSDWINELAMKRIKRNNRKLFINAAGADYFLYRAYLNGRFRYSTFDDNSRLINFFDNKSIRSKFCVHSTISLYKCANGIIPVIPFSYEIPYEGMKNLRKTILFPINYHKIRYTPNTVSDKIIFFHGINRPIDKGSPYIIEAMNIVEKKYPKDVKCMTVERLPYDQYLQTLQQANVILDQCKGYGYGMNAAISLAMGKIVMAGSEPEFIEAGKLYDCPVYNITPNVSQIVEQMEKIINSRKQIHEIGQKGREYVIEHHDYIKIAQEYVEEWKK